MKANVSSLFLLVALFDHLYTLLAALDSGGTQTLFRAQRHRRGLVTDDEDIVLAGKEGLLLVVNKVNHSIRASVLNNLGDATNSASGCTASDASQLLLNEWEVLNDLSCFQVNLD